jgi:hypothetical protein
LKRFVQILMVLCLMIFSTSVALANSDKATIIDNADITSIHRLALGKPLYLPRDEKAPSVEQLIKIESEASKVARMYVLPYDQMTDSIKNDAKVDISNLERHKAAKIFQDNAAKYSDAYVILTVANDNRTVFFFDVYKSGTNQLLYTYEIFANRSEDDNDTTFQNLCEQFYKNFERSIASQQKSQQKNQNKKKD